MAKDQTRGGWKRNLIRACLIASLGYAPIILFWLIFFVIFQENSSGRIMLLPTLLMYLLVFAGAIFWIVGASQLLLAYSRKITLLAGWQVVFLFPVAFLIYEGLTKVCPCLPHNPSVYILFLLIV